MKIEAKIPEKCNLCEKRAEYLVIDKSNLFGSFYWFFVCREHHLEFVTKGNLEVYGKRRR